MQTRPFEQTGKSVSTVGYGAWAIGGSMWGGPRDAEAVPALEKALDLGVTLIDTALVYGDGHSEELVGRVLKARKAWDQVLVATKVPPKNLEWPGKNGTPVQEAFPRDWVIRCAERSLRNLGHEPLDLLQLHVWADNWINELDWYEGFEKLREQGKVRWFGVSLNDHRPDEGVALARSGLVQSLQVIYNVFDQSPEDALFPAAQAGKVAILARVPLDEGSLTGKFTDATRFPKGDFRQEYFGGGLLHETIRRVKTIQPILKPHGSTLAQAALRFCVSHPAVTSVIPGMRSPTQAEDNCAAGSLGPLPGNVLVSLKPHRWIPRRG